MASTTSLPTTTREVATGEPSMENPTKDYLNTITKVQLQKHCRNIGLSNVWANKDQLMDMIMAHHSDEATPPCNTSSPSKGRSVNSTPNEEESDVSPHSESDSIVYPRDEPISTTSLCSESDSAISESSISTISKDSVPYESVMNHKRLECEIKKLYEWFEEKNSEIKHNYEEIKKMNASFQHLNERLTKLEETVHGGQHSDSVPAATQSDEPKNTTSLITNLNLRICELEKKVNVNVNTQAGDTNDVRQTPQPNHDSPVKKTSHSR